MQSFEVKDRSTILYQVAHNYEHPTITSFLQVNLANSRIQPGGYSLVYIIIMFETSMLPVHFILLQ